MDFRTTRRQICGMRKLLNGQIVPAEFEVNSAEHIVGRRGRVCKLNRTLGRTDGIICGVTLRIQQSKLHQRQFALRRIRVSASNCAAASSNIDSEESAEPYT